MKPSILFALVAASALSAQPCLAAADFRDNQNLVSRSGAFAGLGIRMALERGRIAAPTARLKLGMSHSLVDASSGAPVRVAPASSLELGFTGKAKPRLFVGGQSLADMKQRLGFRGSTGTILLIVAGVAAAGAAAYLIFKEEGWACIPEDLECMRKHS